MGKQIRCVIEWNIRKFYFGIQLLLEQLRHSKQRQTEAQGRFYSTEEVSFSKALSSCVTTVEYYLCRLCSALRHANKAFREEH